jgi:hypothetical protein
MRAEDLRRVDAPIVNFDGQSLARLHDAAGLAEELHRA